MYIISLSGDEKNDIKAGQNKVSFTIKHNGLNAIKIINLL